MGQKTINFYRQNGEYGIFSNFYGAPIEIDGELWPTSEHYFQAQKFPIRPELQQKIRNLSTPSEAAKAGRRRDYPLREDWESVKEDVMMRALIAKFTQHEDLKRQILDTGDAKLVEHTARDRVRDQLRKEEVEAEETVCDETKIDETKIDETKIDETKIDENKVSDST
ncbi:3971_t:CDS:2 [Paraglomus occultum]|uniref:3971_t:CDS:1 n=1 Tax=Paraglomus occultum TaxID=144539 RepID=A0A9N9ARL8_9GLOM|nr:3971_t:CDS:2 [Paraglomus occultum]